MARVTVLFVRSLGDVPASLKAVSDLTDLHQSRHPSEGTDEVEGIWVHPTLDHHLVAPPAADAPEPPLWVRESSGVSGLWSYAYLDGPLVRLAADAAERRVAIASSLTTHTSSLPDAVTRHEGHFLPWPQNS